MTEQTYHYRISPGVVKNDIFLQRFDLGSTTIAEPDPCCVTANTTTQRLYGYTYVYSSMTQILSGGTNGTSLLTGLTIPIMLTENTVDVGYYSVFDGMIYQQDVISNFIFSGTSIEPYRCYFYNTSDIEFQKYLSFSVYTVDWGDGTQQQLTTGTTNYSHVYQSGGEFVIRLTGTSPWGNNIVEKTIYLPFTGTTYPNLNGTAFFVPSGGSWSGIPLSYDYIYSADSICDVELEVSSNYTPVPFIVSGYTKSRLQDLQVYGPKNSLFLGKYLTDTPVTGTSGVVGVVSNQGINPEEILYTIDGIDYIDFADGTTVFIVRSSGITEDMIICSPITKNEVLLNVISETQVQSNIYIERGKNSALEKVQRLGEVDNVGDLTKYGYGFFKVKKQ